MYTSTDERQRRTTNFSQANTTSNGTTTLPRRAEYTVREINRVPVVEYGNLLFPITSVSASTQVTVPTATLPPRGAVVATRQHTLEKARTVWDRNRWSACAVAGLTRLSG